LKALREIADVLIAEAKAGNIQAIREIADRLDGKVVQQVEPVIPTSLADRRKLTYEIVHVVETREQDENGDMVVDYRELKAIEGNGRDHADGEIKPINGNGHEQRE
jgi:ribosomal protein L17